MVSEVIIKSNETKITGTKATASIMPIETVTFIPGREAIPAIDSLSCDNPVFSQDAKEAVEAVEMVKPVSGRPFVPGYQEITVYGTTLAVLIETINRMEAEGFILPEDSYVVPDHVLGFNVVYRIPKITDLEIGLFKDAFKKTKSKDGYNKVGIDALKAVKAAAKAALKPAAVVVSEEEKAAAKAAKKAAKERAKAEAKAAREKLNIALTPEEKAANKKAAAERSKAIREENRLKAIALMEKGDYDTDFIPATPVGHPATPVAASDGVQALKETLEEELPSSDGTPIVGTPVDVDVDVDVDEWPGTDVFGK